MNSTFTFSQRFLDVVELMLFLVGKKGLISCRYNRAEKTVPQQEVKNTPSRYANSFMRFAKMVVGSRGRNGTAASEFKRDEE